MVAFTDSPDFDDGVANDAEVLSRIAAYINAIYKLKQPIAGVLYLHDITKEKMGGVGIRRGFMKYALQRLVLRGNWPLYSTFCGVTAVLLISPSAGSTLSGTIFQQSEAKE